MEELYKLNKDELIKLILNLRGNTSTEDLKKELQRREDCEEITQLKKSLLNLKVIPHLTKFIKEYELHIKNSKTVQELMEYSDFSLNTQKLSIYGENRRALYFDIMRKNSWVTTDKIVYCQCNTCTSYEILLYKNGELKQVEIVVSNGWGTEYQSQFINSLCPSCRL